MGETLLILLTAHLLGDFVLQTRWMVERKGRPSILLLHVVLVTGATAALLGSAHPWILGATSASHLAMDALKVHAMRGRPWTELGRFVIDQLVHLGVIVVLGAIFPAAAARGFWLSHASDEGRHIYLNGLTLVSGAILSIPVGGILIALFTKPLTEEMRSVTPSSAGGGGPGEGDGTTDLEGLRRGGLIIGWLERSLVLLLVLIGEPGSIGFLLAAKSILRFGDIRDAHQRRMTEYVIIGSFASFGWALLVSAVTRRALALWSA